MAIKIKLIILGSVPHEFNSKKIINWNSNIFQINKNIDKYSVTTNSDIEDWEYSDINIENNLPKDFNEDILIAITNLPLEKNYYSRRLSDNRICITFFEMAKLLKKENIPLENLILKLLYAYSFAYISHNNSLPTTIEFSSFTHDETKGCIYDMNGIKEDVIFSVNKPIICNTCCEKLLTHRVPENLLHDAHRELKKIQKLKYYRILDFIKRNPILSLILSSLFAIILNIISSLILMLFE